MPGEYNVDVHPSVYMILTLNFISVVSSLLFHLMALSVDKFIYQRITEGIVNKEV